MRTLLMFCFVGAAFMRHPEDLEDLLVFLAGAGLLYSLFALVELRLSPRIHAWVYGYQQTEDFAQAIRFGGYRPMVFMQHGLELGLWMSAACLAGYWLWRAGLWQRLALPEALARRPGLTLVGLAATTVACKSTGAIVLGVVGAAVLHYGRSWRSPNFLIALMLVPAAYVAPTVFANPLACQT